MAELVAADSRSHRRAMFFFFLFSLFFFGSRNGDLTCRITNKYESGKVYGWRDGEKKRR